MEYARVCRIENSAGRGRLKNKIGANRFRSAPGVARNVQSILRLTPGQSLGSSYANRLASLLVSGGELHVNAVEHLRA